MDNNQINSNKSIYFLIFCINCPIKNTCALLSRTTKISWRCHQLIRRTLTLIAFIFLFSNVLLSNSVSAATTIKGTFVKVTYDEISSNTNTFEKQVKSVTIKNDKGKNIHMNMERNASLSVDTLPVKIDAFKLGMTVEADVVNNRIKSLRGKTGTQPGQLDERGTVMFGTIQHLNSSGNFLNLKSDTGELEKYYLKRNTLVYKNNVLENSNTLKEGDRVKLTIETTGSSYMDKIEILGLGTEIDSFRKGTIHQIDPVTRKINIRNGSKFLTFWWGSQSYYDKSNTFSIVKDASIYYGDQLVSRENLRSFANREAYFITTMNFGNEQVERIIIQHHNFQSNHEVISSINLRQDFLDLRSSGKIYFHEGTIFIRNKRLVDPISIKNNDKAYIITDVIDGNRYASVVYITD